MRRNTRRFIAFFTILSFFTVTIGVPSDAQAATGAWEASTTLLDTGSGAAYDPQIAMDSIGNAMAVWKQMDSSGHYSILANHYSDGAWAGAVWLEAGTGDATNPKVAMSTNGNAMVVWQQVDSSNHYSILANRYSAGAWAGAVWLESGTGEAASPNVAMDNSGNAMAVWQQIDSSNHYSILANRYSAGAWAGAVWLESGTGEATSPNVAMSINGDAIVVWQQVDSTGNNSILANRYSASVWRGAIWLESAPGTASNPQIAMDNNGNAMVVWEQYDDYGFHHSILANFYSAGAWKGVTISDSNKIFSIWSLLVAMDNNGNAMVMWEQKYMTGPRNIYLRHYSAGSWGEVVLLNSDEPAWSPHVVMDNGNSMIVWGQSDTTGHQSIYARHYSAGSWGVDTLLNSVEDAGSPHVAMDINGNAIVVWEQLDSSGQQNIYAKRLFSGVIDPITVPSAPTLSSATPGNGKVSLTWTAPSSNGDSAIDYYVIYQDGVALADHQAGLTAIISGLSNGHQYNFTIAAHNLAGIGPKSNAISSIPYSVPDAPRGLAGTLGDGQVTLNWTAPGFNGGRGIDYYIVYQDGLSLPYHLTGPSTIIAGLTNGHAYSFTVCAHNVAGIGPQTTAVTITPSTVPTVPSAPTGLSAGPRNGQVSLGWSAPSATGGVAIDYYIVYQNGTDIAHPTSTSMIVTGLANGISYSFKVAAHNAVGTGPQSSSVSATPFALTDISTVPDLPTGLTAIPGNAQVSLSWTAPADDGGAAIDYYVVYQDGADVQHPTGTSVTVTGLTNGQAYGFRVAAHNSVGVGNPSTPATATPAIAPTVPGAPTGIGAIPGNGQVSLSWIAPNNNGGAAIDYYLIFVNGIVLTDHYPSTTATITGLINDQQYSIAIAAHNSVGASVQSSTITATPSATTNVPGVPLGLVAIPGNAQVTLTWSAPTSNGGEVIDYYIVHQGGVDISHPVAASAKISGLTNGQSYDFTVAAHNSVGTGVQSSLVTATPTSGVTVPGAPTDLVATPGPGKVTLSWGAPSGSSVIDYYIVYQNGIDVVHTPATSATITGLTGGEGYTFVVAAHNSVGVGTQSSSGTVTPSAVSPNSATASTGTDSMVIYAGILALMATVIIGLLLIVRRKKKDV